MKALTYKEALGLNACFSFFFPKEKESLNLFLPKNIQASLREYPLNEGAPEAFLENASKVLEHFHFTWLEEPLQTFPPPLRQSLLSCLSEKIQKEFSFEKTHGKSLPFFCPLLLQQLAKKLWDDTILFEGLLPQNVLNVLLRLSHEELLNLIDYLGMVDFAEEIRVLVDGKVLKQLYASFSKKQLSYLKQCLHLKPKKEEKSSYLKDIKNTKDLQKKLQNQGLKNLSLVFSEKESDLLWHLTRRLPKPLGIALLELHKNKKIAPLEFFWKKEVENFLKKVDK